MKKLVELCFFVVLTAGILTHSSLSLAYAALGLELWYEKMVPVLLPFLILSGTLIRMGLVPGLIRPIQPIFAKIFRLSPQAVYVILTGFLCGFPMGARTIADFRNRQELSIEEGQYLLAFCNNLGPVYFLGFVLPLLQKQRILPYLAGMYGIPLAYGLLLRYTVYREKIIAAPDNGKGENGVCPKPLLDALDESVTAAGHNILQLGGYMIFFNLLNLLPAIFFTDSYRYAPLLEISGGLQLLGSRYPLYTLLLLPAGGLSCLVQTGSCIRGTGLSLANYFLHKMILTGLTGLYYLGWFLLFPDTFLL